MQHFILREYNEAGDDCVNIKIAELKCKEVINITDGQRLGFISDVLFSADNGGITALVIPGRMKFLGLFGHEDDIIIPWDAIRKVSDDIILVELPAPSYEKNEKSRVF